MSLIRWQPLKELDTLRHQMNHLFDELLHGDREFGQFPKLDNIVWAPAIELKESDNNLVLKAVIPGIEANDLDIQVSENAVLIKGEHRQESRTEDKGYFRSELQYGEFQRIIPLPVSVKHTEVQSEFSNGVLVLTLPKADPAAQTVTKIDLTTQEKAREAVTQQRQRDEHLQDTVHTRVAADIATPRSSNTEEEARELAAKQRQHTDHLQDTVHTRAADNLSS
ncbi:MAG TPA: Hsp20/alpha crystallin family protein [Leptolyngbyaceae cyanobacterium M33_DOE_097]|uniref:Hsp20/alpha crystallin family protein n=1 Tax=Oscillatoriales cyanobacterium SpSt-418 TaxID=2282169 RepID=A0A7C3PM41_9CYAN|nr:Hsp20/alpha crystallin family protein [Leptolyngbyaceae cyanobacterium M33_DOE_097]